MGAAPSRRRVAGASTGRIMRHVLRRAAALAAAIAFALVAAACGAGGNSGSSNAKKGQRILRYGYDLQAQFTNTFDLAKSTGDCDQIVEFPIFDTLVHKEPGNKLVPGLAESWDVPDASTFVIHLRPGLTFHNGTKLDAQAVIDGLKRNAKNDQFTDLHAIDKFEAVDATTVKLHFNKQLAPVMAATFTNRDGMIMAATSTATKPVGAGPFMFTQYTPGVRISVRKFDKYWDKSVYQGLDGIDFDQVGTGPPAVAALQAGDLDLVRMEAESYEPVKKNAKLGIAVQTTGSYLQFEFRIKFKPFSDVRVRQAVNFAIDRDEINRVVQKGLGEVASQPFPKDSPSYVPDLANTYTYNPDRARQLLSDAGYPNGFDMVMVIPGGGIKNMEDQGALIQEQLKKVGIRATIQRILGNDIGSQFYLQGVGDAFSAAELDTTLPMGKLYNNYAKFQYVAIYDGAERDDITELMKKANASTDQNEVIDLMHQGVKIAVEQALDVPIAFMPQFMAYDKARVSGTVGGQTNICDQPDLTKTVVKASS